MLSFQHDDSNEHLASLESLQSSTLNLKSASTTLLRAIRASCQRKIPNIGKDEANFTQQRLFDPDAVGQSRNQWRLNIRYQVEGVPGLMQELRDIAEEREMNLPHSANRRIIQDFDNQENSKSGMLRVLSCINHQMLEAMLQGNISEKVLDCEEFADTVARIHTPRPCPGVYIVEVVNDQRLSTDGQLYAGRFLNWHGWHKIWLTMSQYVQAWRDWNQTEVPALVTDIDTQISDGFYLDRPFRYIPQHRNLDTIDMFLNRIYGLFVRAGEGLALDDPRLDVPYKRNIMYVGWGNNSEIRSFAHIGQRKSGVLTGLFDATLRYCFDGFPFTVKRYLACRIVQAKDAPLAECLISEICQSYWLEGGLNADFAGTMHMQGGSTIDQPRYKPALRRNVRHVVRSRVVEDNTLHIQRHDKAVCDALTYANEHPYHELVERMTELDRKVQTLIHNVEATTEVYLLEKLNERLREVEAGGQG